VSVGLGPIASTVAAGFLGTGGGAYNGNLFLNFGDAPTKFNAGSENTFAGDKAGSGLYGASSYNLAIGHNACGAGDGTNGVTADFMVCLGGDAGRNLTGSASAGSDILIGFGTGRNEAAGFNVMIGGSVADSNGVNSPGALTGINLTLVGYGVGRNITTAGADTLIGANAGSQLVGGSGDVIIEASGSGDNCADGDEVNVLRLCSGLGPVFTVLAGGGTLATTITQIPGTLQLKTTTGTSGGVNPKFLCIGNDTGVYASSTPCVP
jgi:hypothetical protein